MNKALRIVELAWLAMAAICIIEVFRMGDWSEQSWYFAGGAVLAIFMFWFRRRQRLRYQKRQEEREQHSGNETTD